MKMLTYSFEGGSAPSNSPGRGIIPLHPCQKILNHRSAPAVRAFALGVPSPKITLHSLKLPVIFLIRYNGRLRSVL